MRVRGEQIQKRCTKHLGSWVEYRQEKVDRRDCRELKSRGNYGNEESSRKGVCEVEEEEKNTVL